MIEYWQTLLGGLDAGRPWDDQRKRFALDLLGVPQRPADRSDEPRRAGRCRGGPALPRGG